MTCMCVDCRAGWEPTPMNPELKVKWLAALRSGDFVQGNGVLKREDALDGSFTHCCLGVLGDVMVAEGLVETQKPVGTRYGSSPDHEFKTPDSNYWVNVMPSPEMNTASGLDQEAASVLAGMNDSDGKSFAEIAAWIEEKL